MNNPWKISTFVLAALLAVSVSASWIPRSLAGQDESHMVRALEHLQSAEKELTAAKPKSPAYKVKALKLVKAAQAQVRKGMTTEE